MNSKRKSNKSWSTSPKIAILLSIVLHLFAFLAFRGVSVINKSYSLMKGAPVSLIELPQGLDSNTKIRQRQNLSFVPRRARDNLPEIAPRQLVPDVIPSRQSITKIERDVILDQKIPPIDASFSEIQRLSDLNSYASMPGLPLDGTSDGRPGAKGTSKEGGSGKGRGLIEPDRLLSTQVETPKREIEMSEIQVYKEKDLPFINAFDKISKKLANAQEGHAVDITFLLDISESMADNIDAVRRHLYRIVDTLEKSKIDYTIGIVTFHDSLVFEWLGTDIEVYEQTKNFKEIEKILKGIKVSGGEKPLDAIMKAISKVKFRQGASKRFILITDEYVKGSYSVSDVLQTVKRNRITVDVIGMDEPFQRAIAEQTGGFWMPIETLDSK